MADAMKLLPCPFCGGPASYENCAPGDPCGCGQGWVACLNDECPVEPSVDDGSHEERIAAWNRRAALTPRHEAPAEGAGEREIALALREARNRLHSGKVVLGDIDAIMDAVQFLEDQAALRARSSAPEAREGEAPVRGEIRIVNGKRCRFIERELEGDKWEVIGPAHPAAPSADKLRIAVEALEPFANLGVSSGPDDEPCHYAYRITRGAIRNARQALAALKAEGTK